MENVADALKMAGSVLIFVLALSIAILSFGQVRETADIILDYKDRETVYIDGSLYYETSGTERTVGLETVIPAIYRAYLENYKIVFEGFDSGPIYTIAKNDGTEIQKYSFDLETNKNTDYENVVLANNEKKAEFLRGILYGKFKVSKSDFETKFNVKLPGGTTYTSLYDRLKGKTIKEYLGVYYQDDSEDIPEVNKIQKRIITYIIQ